MKSVTDQFNAAEVREVVPLKLADLKSDVQFLSVERYPAHWEVKDKEAGLLGVHSPSSIREVFCRITCTSAHIDPIIEAKYCNEGFNPYEERDALRYVAESVPNTPFMDARAQ